MNNDTIAHIRKEKSFNLNNWQYVQAYPFSILIAIYLVYVIMDNFLFNEIDVDRQDRVMQTLPFFIGAFILLTWQRRKTLKFKTLQYFPSEEEFQNAVRTTASQMNWQFKYHEPDFVIATFRNRTRSRESQEITIFYDKDGVHINSMTELSIISIPFSFGNRRKAIWNFFLNLKYEIEGIDSENKLQEKITEKENESEWNYDNFVKRVFAYFFILIWILLFVSFLWTKAYISALVFSPIIIVSILYIYFDVKVVLGKRKRNKNKGF